VQRIVVYGVTGSGKSTLARRIGERLGLPYHPVDDLAWRPGWVAVPEAEQRERIRAICAGERWVLDAAYGSWLDVVLPRTDLIVCLDLPRAVSLSRLLHRTVDRIVRGTPICNGNRETWRKAFFDRESILVWHFRSFGRKRRRMRAWHADSRFPATVLLRSGADVERWFAALPTTRDA
jgi:adenylate kinase family enzyme